MVADTETFTGALGDARAFCEVVDFGSISEAARRLGESKGAVSRRITRLEAKLGVRLLARTSRAVTATEEGVAFHAKAQAGLALLDEAADSARGQREIPRGHLRITCAIDLSIELLPPLAARFLTRYPQITLEIIVTDTPIDLAAHRIDLALRIGIGALPDQAYRGVELATGSVGLYAAPAWITVNGMPSSPGDLEGRDMVLAVRQMPERGFPLKDAQGRPMTLRGRAVARASDFATVIRLAEAGIGAAFLPDLMIDRALRAGSLVPLLPAWRFPGIKIHALTLAGRDVPARVRLFREFLKTELRGIA